MVLVHGCAKPLPVLSEVPEFSFTDQNGRTIHRSDLEDKVWVVDFIYVGCSKICPLLTQNMGKLQSRFSHDPDVKLVSFSVDPENDTQERLASYAQAFGANSNQWFFLRGPLKEIEYAVIRGFQTNLGKMTDYEIVHSLHFILVDRHARIRGYFDTNTEKGLDKVSEAIRQLLKES